MVLRQLSSRFMRALLITFLGFACACNGKLYQVLTPTPDPCAGITCAAAQHCVLGQCINDATAACNPLTPEGPCGAMGTCFNGVCYPADATPTACSVSNPNGVCDDNQACASGTCTAIASGTECSPTNQAGVCPGGQLCVDGWCYVDDGTIACSRSNLAGFCTAGKTCFGGVCQAFAGSCSPDNFGGSCATWETCAEGECVGPVPPDACSSTLPAGRCPAEQVCVGGTCTPLTSNNTCSPSNTSGLCPTSAACQQGYCVAVSSSNACSTSRPLGLCTGGATCQNGVCVQLSCNVSGTGYLCPADEMCTAGSCSAELCDPVHQHGYCNDSTLACVGGVCNPPSCSIAVPTGTCQQGLVCTNGICTLPACSFNSPNGPCPDPNAQVCTDGVCVNAPCSAINLEGTCGGTGNTCDPNYGCNNAVPLACCDANLQTLSGCRTGTCAPSGCDSDTPRGACNTDQFCNNGTCQRAPCGVYFLDGFCTDPNASCVFGQCARTHCSEQANPNAYCAPNVCSPQTDVCVVPPCSPSTPQGTCNVGLTCCNSALQATDPNCTTIGTCYTPGCSAAFPGGTCASGLLCAGGACEQPPCSSDFPNGTCGSSYTCNAGVCVQLPCSSTAPRGSCPAQQRCFDANGTIGCVAYVCGADFPNGPCPAGTICQAGSPSTCITPTCSAQYPGPGSACPASQICIDGNCIKEPCSSQYPAGQCATGFDCTAGRCVPQPCSVASPRGPCSGADAGKVCVSGTCRTYTCSSTFPSGPCAVQGQVCLNNSCQNPNCSPTYISGKCPNANQLCDNGSCSPAPCSTAHPTGVCPSSQTCTTGGGKTQCVLQACNATNTEGFCTTAGQTCCDAALHSANFCPTLGACVNTTCSTQFPFGQCSDGNKICVNSTCTSPCSGSNKTGWCPGGFACVQGACANTCSSNGLTDSDCDYISDNDEGAGNQPATDTDGDGVPDYLDHDSDNDTLPDSVEAGDHDVLTKPADTDGDGLANFRSLDSDGDTLSDTFEAGPAPGVPRDTDGDGAPDYADIDSDNDGIYDHCEGPTPNGSFNVMACNNTARLTVAVDTDNDGLPDYRDLDSDNDGVNDAIEARNKPANLVTLSHTSVDHDNDGVPDQRDTDSDNDGVTDRDEDVNGDGIVNCQVDGSGVVVPDLRATPTCGSTSTPFSATTPYDYNPGCPTQKCLLAETDRIFADTDGNGIADGSDTVFLVCSAANLKPINVFFSQPADYAAALETTYSKITPLTRSGNRTGMLFDDPNTNNGSNAVSGFLLSRTPDSTAIGTTNSNPAQALIDKALAEALDDKTRMAGTSGVKAVTLILDRNFTSFDGYGAVVSRYDITTSVSLSVARLRTLLLAKLDSTVDTVSNFDNGPTANDFTLTIETLYRYDNGSNAGTVMVMGALIPTGVTYDSTATYNYRTRCAQQSSSACTSRVGCMLNGSSCIESPAYQIPLFYADNISNGSALTQYGDSYAALCESFVQKNGPLDVMWVVDNSGSMAPKIGQVVNASALFFPILANSETDYRIGMVSTSESSPYWPAAFPGCNGQPKSGCGASTGCQWNSTTSVCVPLCTLNATAANCSKAGCTWNTSNSTCNWGGCSTVTTSSLCSSFGCVWNSTSGTCNFNGYVDRNSGNLAVDFTGAVAGITNLSAVDRSSNYSCSQGCLITACAGLTQTKCAANIECSWNGSSCVTNCCPACLTNSSLNPNDPACYFAANLPNDTGSGNEYGLMMGEWAGFRAGAQPTCAAALNSTTCVATPGCTWNVNACVQSYCFATVASNDQVGSNTPQAQCMGYDPTVSPRIIPPFSTTSNDPAAAFAPPGCEWNSQEAGGAACVPSVGPPCTSYGSQALCNSQVPRCGWVNNICVPNEPGGRVLCNGTSQVQCLSQGYGWCQWDSCNYANESTCESVFGCAWNGTACLPLANSGTCRPPLKRMLRANAALVSVVVSDEEECYLKDGANSNGGGGAQYDGNCAGGYLTGGLLAYNDPVRLARVRSYTGWYQSHGFTAFALTGDQANISLAPETTSLTNGGCNNPNLGYEAEAGQSYVDVAEGTGGGWGSICAQNLFPSIEAITIASISKASPYRLEGFISGTSVQPISSTIEVAVQVCKNASEYPSCQSGTQSVTVPRSRDNGFDYDPINNSLILYGTARAVTAGDISVSYRYWVNNQEPPGGASKTCPCPETLSNTNCACNPGLTCGVTGSGSNEVDTCAPVTNVTTCNQKPGCTWNSASNGFCESTGLCEPDPSCGGSCATGLVCDPTRGLCVCDVSCGGSCPVGSACDNNDNFYLCQGLSASACAGVSGCAYNTTLQACLSATCGKCLCDTTCGGGCPAGGVCNTDTTSATCGQCSCDTTCGGGCPANEVCNSDTTSGTCGLCQPPPCGHCPQGFVCNPALNVCVCDTTCGGSTCARPYVCDTSSNSATCGQCVCDTTCNGGCAFGQVCDSNTSSSTCGLCAADPQCGQPGGNCNQTTCASNGTSQNVCNAISGCRWAPWLNNGNGACTPVTCEVCSSTIGVCVPDTQCCNACGPSEVCNVSTGQCECDTTCGYSCAPGTVCDNSTASNNCGQCLCDTTCGGACPTGLTCDNNAECGSVTDQSLCFGNCAWDAAVGLCYSTFCGYCTVDPTCGGCPNGGTCNTTTGLCTNVCPPSCPAGQVCNPFTQQCACDATCGGLTCASGSLCDSNPNDTTCGQCTCDTTCGGVACPAGQVCDKAPGSPTCGTCLIDSTCGGGCPAPFVCDPLTGLCVQNPSCGGCPAGFQCNRATGRCVAQGG